MRTEIRFLLGDELRTLRNFDPSRTVLDWLRLEVRRTGTKEGCNEGDCGACTVVLAEIAPGGGHLHYRAVDACITFLGQLDGRQLLTVEDLQGPDDALHPVQAALVETHGSQCGFCTPGFVMALFAHLKNGGERDVGAVDDALAGNLCRCTGYGPIVAAAALAQERMAGNTVGEGEAETLRILGSLQDEADIEIEGPDGRRFLAPASLDTFARILIDEPDATVVAGATDVGLWVTKQMRALDPLVWLGRIGDLRTLEETAESIVIGAGVRLEEALPLLARHWPDVGELLRRFGSLQVRNAGTLGGNVANGSPIGDSIPALMALGAEVVLRKGSSQRTLALDHLYTGYMEQVREPGEFVACLLIPKPAPGAHFCAYKISKRFDQDISAVCGCFQIRLVDDVVDEARIAFGGMAATARRARQAEVALRGRPWTPATIAAACEALGDDFSPISDMRASAAYRLEVARNLLTKAFIETTEPEVETRLVGTRRRAAA